MPNQICACIDRLSAEEAGDICGVSKWTIYKRAKKKEIPVHHIGKRLCFSGRELIALGLQI